MRKSLIVFLFLTVSLFAGDKRFHLYGGLNYSWFVYEMDVLNDLDPDFVLKPQIAIQYDFMHFGDFTSSAGIRYFHLGRQLTAELLEEEDPETIWINNHFISLPLQLKYTIESMDTHLLLNLETALLVKSSAKSPDHITGINTERTTTDEMNKMHFLLGAGVEYNFHIGQESFGIRALFNYILTKIPKEDIYTDGPNREYSWVGFKAMEVGLLLSYNF